MSGGQPWALVVQAGELDVNRRAELAAALAELVEFHRHWVLLATCHRVELYGFGQSPAQQEMRRLEGESAVRQLFRVAAGLESAVVGESEVLGQVRDAMARARERGTDERVARLFITTTVFTAAVGLAIAIPTGIYPLLPASSRSPRR